MKVYSKLLLTQPKKRPTSLKSCPKSSPAQPKILQRANENPAIRKNRIFKQDDHSPFSEKAICQQQVEKISVAVQYQPFKDVKNEKKKTQKEIEQKEIGEKIYQRVMEKLLESDLLNSLKLSSIAKMSQKNHELSYLKQEVERLRRCDRLSKQNQSLYSRLVDKLQESLSQQNYLNSSQTPQTKQCKKNTGSKNSPVRYLEQMSARNSSPQGHRIEQNEIINKKIALMRYPQKAMNSINSPTLHSPMKSQESYHNSGKQNSPVFTHSPSRPTHPKMFKKSILAQSAKMLKKQEEHLQAQADRLEFPINSRLHEMNLQLQRKMSLNNIRSNSRSRHPFEENSKYESIAHKTLIQFTKII